MKSIKFILTIIIFTFGCGDKNVTRDTTESIISNTDSIVDDEFCLQLDHDLNIEFHNLDSLIHSTGASDSVVYYLKEANDNIFFLLSSMVQKNQFHICKPCNSAKVSYAISSDKKLALFSWNSRFGGTMRAYTTCAIYQTDNTFKVKWLNNFIHDTTIEFSELNYASYRHIYSLIMQNGNTLYFPYGYGIAATLSPWRTIKAFQISKDLEELKIFPEGKSELFCDYDFTLLNPYNLPDSVIEIHFSETENKLEIPITEWGRPTGEYITLIFDGKKFDYSSNASP